MCNGVKGNKTDTIFHCFNSRFFFIHYFHFATTTRCFSTPIGWYLVWRMCVFLRNSHCFFYINISNHNLFEKVKVEFFLFNFWPDFALLFDFNIIICWNESKDYIVLGCGLDSVFVCAILLSVEVILVEMILKNVDFCVWTFSR